MHNNINKVFSYIKSIIGPAPKLHFAILIIKRKPSDINLTARLENARRNVCALPITGHHNIGLVGPIKCFTCAEK